ncbi:granzyme B(G,H)-like [Lepisosteus oculatus]|uniref:trypsin n=1 Tax=Lepisosteus oculatus TaxID=7918 RepID=W5MDB6_LEPOC|nr:PREDICTED: granzyme B(G,H)-like isoform X2 [Lepisosteus oculatus]
MKVVSVAVVWALSIYLAGGAQIIGGREATPHSRPYMAYLSMVRGTKCVSCGGFLVRNDFIMTAAHCSSDNITAILGAHNMVQDENSQQIIPVAKSFPFPDFCPRELDNDIMLLKLRWNATLNSAVGVLPLPKKVRDVRVGRSCSVAGWGAMDTEGEKPSPTLQEVNVTVVRRLCAQTWGRQFNEYKVCAAGPLKGGCSGDSGAPLVCRGVAIGILSFGGKPCGYFPSVFTKVAMYLDWARDVLANN